MRAAAVLRAVSGGLFRRRLQTVVIGLVVLISAAASTLGLGLLVDSNGPFQHAFAVQRGADVIATVDAARATSAQLAATARLPGVSAASGPFAADSITPQVTMSGRQETLPPVTLAGRASAGGPVDDVTLDAGRWAQRRGEVVLSRDFPSADPRQLLGQQITVTGVPGRPRLTVVGIGKSITDSADGWVSPAQAAALSVLRPPRVPPAAQMLYRFQSAGTPAAIRADVAALRAALPAGALAGSQSYLTVKDQQTKTISIIVPFVVAFGILALAMSVLIVGNVVSGAVVAGYHRIGVLKSIGFTPAQVVAAYVGQAGAPALAGCLLGILGGNVLAAPLLSQTATIYGVGRLLVPASVDVAVPVVTCALVGLAALFPALRAGRLSAVEALASGRAPRPGRGYAAHRLLGRLHVPRPVTIGLAAPFARPARTLVTLAAILFGATTVIFAAGLARTLEKAANGQSHATSEQVLVWPAAQLGGPGSTAKGSSTGPVPGHPQSAARADRAVQAALRVQPATLRFVAETMLQVSVPGLTRQAAVEAFRGNAAWTGYGMISGHWYARQDQVVVNTAFLTATGKSVGDTAAISFGGRLITVRIVGEAFDPQAGQAVLLTSWQTLGGAGAGLTAQVYDVQLRPGADPRAYLGALRSALGPAVNVTDNADDPFYQTLLALIGTLTLLLALVAGLGVLNTVVLSTRDRVHDLGVFKAVGMTPRQTIAMVVCWVVAAGLAAGFIAVPAGTILHAHIVRAMAAAGGTGLPVSYLNVLAPWALAALAGSGLVLAVAGALPPASWAARARTAAALRAE